jgi:hypothetical protein
MSAPVFTRRGIVGSPRDHGTHASEWEIERNQKKP